MILHLIYLLMEEISTSITFFSHSYLSLAYRILFLFIFITGLWHSISFHIYHCFMKFYFFSYLSLAYSILFLFILIIVLLDTLSFHIYHCFMKFFFFSYLSLLNIIHFLFIIIVVLWWSLNINECPLSIAIKWNSTEIVKFLVEHSADVNTRLIIFLFIFIIALWHSLSFYIHHCFMTFSFFSYSSLL